MTTPLSRREHRARAQHAEDAGRAPKRSSFRPDIQGLRAVAVLAVIIFHAGLAVPGGFAGVDVFFAISGYVITAMLLREQAKTGRINLFTFYVRRFKRLTPALAVVVVVTCLASVLLLNPFGLQDVAAKTGVGAMLFVANAVIAKLTGGYFDAAADANPLLHTWSLSVEEQFYFIFPLLVALTIRVSRKLTIAAVTALSLVSFAAALVAGSAWPFGFYGPVTRAWEFGLGALLALIPVALPRKLGLPSAVLGVVALLVSMFAISESLPWPGFWTLLPVVGTVLAIAAGDAGAQNPVTRALGSTPMRVIGDYSYSLYLWHWPFICLATMLSDNSAVKVLAAALSVIPAVLSYRLIETPFRKRSLRQIRSWAPAVVAFSLVPLLVGAGLWFGSKKGWNVPAITQLSARAGTHPGWSDCLRLDTDGTGGGINTPACTFNGKAAGKPVYLVGDSNAAMYSTPAVDAAKASNRPMIERTAAGCAFADYYRGTADGQGPTDKLCRSTYQSVMKELLKQPSGTSVLIGLSPSQWTLEGRALSLDGQRFESGFNNRDEVIRTGFGKTLQQLKDRGLKPALIEPAVAFPDDKADNKIVSCRTTLSIMTGDCPRALPLTASGNENQTLRASMADVARKNRVPLIRVADVQCPNGQCPPSVHGAPVFLDGGHFTANFTQLLTQRFEKALEG